MARCAQRRPRRSAAAAPPGRCLAAARCCRKQRQLQAADTACGPAHGLLAAGEGVLQADLRSRVRSTHRGAHRVVGRHHGRRQHDLRVRGGGCIVQSAWRCLECCMRLHARCRGAHGAVRALAGAAWGPSMGCMAPQGACMRLGKHALSGGRRACARSCNVNARRSPRTPPRRRRPGPR